MSGVASKVSATLDPDNRLSWVWCPNGTWFEVRMRRNNSVVRSVPTKTDAEYLSDVWEYMLDPWNTGE